MRCVLGTACLHIHIDTGQQFYSIPARFDFLVEQLQQAWRKGVSERGEEVKKEEEEGEERGDDT